MLTANSCQSVTAVWWNKEWLHTWKHPGVALRCTSSFHQRLHYWFPVFRCPRLSSLSAAARGLPLGKRCLRFSVWHLSTLQTATTVSAVNWRIGKEKNWSQLKSQWQSMDAGQQTHLWWFLLTNVVIIVVERDVKPIPPKALHWCSSGEADSRFIPIIWTIRPFHHSLHLS